MPSIGRVTPSGSITEFPVSINNRALDITAGPDGAMWIVTIAQQIARVALNGSITNVFDTPTPNSFPRAITAGPDGNLWFTEQAANQIARITTSGVVTEFPVPTLNSAPWAIAAGPDGALWFSEIAGNKMGRISTEGTIREFPFAFPDRGNLWFTESSTNRIGRITPAGIITDFLIPTTTAFPVGIAAGPDGNLWFTESEVDLIGRAVPDRPLTAAGITIRVSPGLPFSRVVATFVDGDAAALETGFTAVIAWGDGGSSSGTVTARPGVGFEVRGDHTYAAAGSYSMTISITDIDSSHDLGGNTATASSLAIVAPLAITTTSPLPPAVTGVPYSQTLAASGGSPPYQWTLDSGRPFALAVRT